MLVYRDSARSVVSGPELDALATIMRGLESDASAYEIRVEALLRAGELECALADLDEPSARDFAAITDALAAHLLGSRDLSAQQWLPQLQRARVPQRLTLKAPKGYAYGALPPEFYAALALGLPRRSAPALVIGIRSIGTSLGAIVVEALRPLRPRAERMSVRPSGPAFDRVLSLSELERARILQLRDAHADFVIVDEGPGMSGSSLLSVARALELCGVQDSRIHLFCSHRPDPSQLLAPRASERWMRYRTYAAGAFRPSAQCRDLSAGAWREHQYDDEQHWPACWPQRERLKWLTPDGCWFDKFEGLPPYGTAALARAQTLAQAGYGPTASALAHGFVRFQFLQGRPCHATELSADRLVDLARYCAFRTRAFGIGDADVAGLQEMLRSNVAELCAVELSPRLSLEVALPVIADARMQPHEWRVDARGKLSKTDGHGHGDDHLLPGPTDIAWDLAGTIVEWQLSVAQADQFVAQYEQLSGDKPRPRLPAYLVAYCALRGGEMSYAARSSSGSEQRRQLAAQDHYRSRLHGLLTELGEAA